MKLTIIYDNTAFRKDLRPDWGFSAFIEAGHRNILFDTGGSGAILLENMQKLGIDLKVITDVFISHAHFDHTGGLSAFLERNSRVTVWVPPSFRGVRSAEKVVAVPKPIPLYDDIYSTGELGGIEQSLCFQTEKGIVVVVGCSHPRMTDILEAAAGFGEVYGIIGGLHGTRPESLKNLALICATHCTQCIPEIRSIYPGQYIEGGAGKMIEI